MNRRNFLQLVGAATAGTFLPGCAIAPAAHKVPPHLKRGLGLGTKPETQWQHKVQSCGARWFYNWNRVPPENIPAGIEFMPMVWRDNPGASYVELGKQLRKAGYKQLLGFNEPDQKKQGNMTVEEALDLWPVSISFGHKSSASSTVMLPCFF